MFGGPALFGGVGERSKHNFLPFCGPSLRDPDVKMNDVQRFTTFTISMLRPSIPPWVITRVQDTSGIETKTNFERHSNTLNHQHVNRDFHSVPGQPVR